MFIDSPADMAGIRSGDIVTAVNSEPVNSIRDLLDQVTLRKPGEHIRITLYRGPELFTLDMQVSQRPST